MERWFWEERTMTGHWMPVTAPRCPETVKVSDGLRIRRVSGTGPRIRTEPKRVPDALRDLPLRALTERMQGVCA
jgi:hypothetical protein